MTDVANLLNEFSKDFQSLFQRRQVILTFQGYLERLKQEPLALIRNAAQYVRDTFDHFGCTRLGEGEAVRFKLFDLGTERTGPIIGGEPCQTEIYSILNGFVRQGHANKLIMLHGPNGSAKSSTIETIGRAMQAYSETEAGAVYRFNWIFPTDKLATTRLRGEAGPIGFGAQAGDDDGRSLSYALLEESKIASKIPSEFKDNPVFLIPMPQREHWLRQWIADKQGIRPDDVELPPHVLLAGLSKRNQLIFENLMAAYEGDFAKVMRHVQVERFFYSRQYRVGIATVEPQMSIDAIEKQLTMDKNIANLPAVLHNISFHEAQGELVEANRGILEFSDMLKRPVEAFKYLLSSVEKESVNLPSSTANLDVVFFGTTNEKHLDAFKTLPDFSSFRGRFELITAPYLLRASQEARIYDADVHALGKSRKVAPHALELLCVWTVMTRLKQPDPEYYESTQRGLVTRLDPRSKLRLYEGLSLRPVFTAEEESSLREMREKIMGESLGVVVYEGRFGASPREVRAILHRAAQNPKMTTLTPMAIFEELEKLVKDRTVYEFLQFEPRGKYHDAALFLRQIKDEFADIFEHEALIAMTLVEEEQYDALLQRYIDNLVATVKRERLYNPKTGVMEEPSATLMSQVEKILGADGPIERFRERFLARIASFKIDNPQAPIDVRVIFDDVLKKLHDHYYAEKAKIIEANFKAMLALGSGDESMLATKEKELAQTTYDQLERKFGYDHDSARESLKFLLAHNKTRKKR